MQSTRHDSSLAALHASSGLPGQVVDVVVLTEDAGLLATLRESSGPEHAIWHATSADLAVDLLVGGRCGILIADLATLRGDAASLLERLHAQFPELILLATGRRDEEHAVASLVSSGHVYRFLHKPISPARAGVFVSAATRRYHELRNVEPLALTTIKTIAARSDLRKIIVLVLAAVALLIAAILWWTGSDTASSSQQRHEAPTQQEQISDLLARAQAAYAQNRLTEPQGDNAVEYFRAVLALQPDRPDARQSLDRITAVLERRVVEALEARDAPRGAVALTALQRAAPGDPRLETLHAQLLAISRSVRLPAPAAARERSSVAQPRTSAPVATRPTPVTQTPPPPATEPAPAAEAAATQTSDEPETAAATSLVADELALIVRLRERGVLIEPAGSNAYDQFIALRERHPESEQILAEQQRLAFALLERTRTALAAEDVDSAADYLPRVEALVPGMATTKTLRQQLADAKRDRDFLTNVVPASSLKLVRSSAPAYPRDAQGKGVEGWVDVEFTVATDGTTQDLVVRNAEPKNVFEQSAIESVQRWRFEPVTSKGVAVRQRAAVRVRFVIE